MLEKKKGKLAKSMIDEIWPIENTLIQYRALVKFTGREIKTRANNNAAQKAKNRSAICQLRKDIDWFRNMYAKSLLGPRQAIHNILREHKDLQLAYEKHDVEILIDIFWQMNWSKIKLLDQLVYHRRKRTEYLNNYQNEKRQHIENLERGSDKLVSREVRSLTNKVHNMQVRKRAAMLINKMYKKAKDILKRDAVFYDTVLGVLEKHTEKELKFIIRITNMGQNATEEHANLEEDYATLEKAVKEDMTIRGRQVRALAREVQILEQSYLGLVRTQNDGNWEKHTAATPSEIKLNKELGELQKIMVMLQDTAHVSSCEDIFKRLKAQVPRKAHLEDTVLYMENVRESLLEKRNHAEIMAAALENKLIDSTAEYKEQKAELVNEITNEEKDIERCTKELEYTGKLMMTLRTSLQTLYDLMQCVKPDKEREVNTKAQPINEEAHVIMKLARFKLRDLIELVPPEEEPSRETVETAKAVFQRAMADKIAKAQYEAEAEVELALDIQELDDPEVVTRTTIKLRSDKIVAEESQPQYY